MSQHTQWFQFRSAGLTSHFVMIFTTTLSPRITKSAGELCKLFKRNIRRHSRIICILKIILLLYTIGSLQRKTEISSEAIWLARSWFAVRSPKCVVWHRLKSLQRCTTTTNFCILLKKLIEHPQCTAHRVLIAATLSDLFASRSPIGRARSPYPSRYSQRRYRNGAIYGS